jgi:hypothetical protein
MSFSIKRGDLLPVLRVQLIDPSGAPADLTGATVVFNMAALNGKAKIEHGPAAVVDAATGLVEYSWSDGDTDTASSFLAEFEVTYSGKRMTYPNNSFFKIAISHDLG